MRTQTEPETLHVRLPKNFKKAEIGEILAQLSAELGFTSKHGPRPDKGSLGHMLVAIATGKAMVINLNKENAPTQENESPLE